jgi:hypothetical protein
MNARHLVVLLGAAACRTEPVDLGAPAPWSSLGIAGNSVVEWFGGGESAGLVRYAAQAGCSESIEVVADQRDGADWAELWMTFDAATRTVHLPEPAAIDAPLQFGDDSATTVVFGGVATLVGPDPSGNLTVEIVGARVCDASVAFGDSPDVASLCGDPETVRIEATGVGAIVEESDASPLDRWEDSNGAPLCGALVSAD